MDVSPAKTGTYVEEIFALSNDQTINSYSIDTACTAGNCPVKCGIKQLLCSDALSYNPHSHTLAMTFTLATPDPATWDTWLVLPNEATLGSLSGFPQPLPITEPQRTVTKTTSVAPTGMIGVLSTLTSHGQITCTNWQTINTATH